MHHAEHYSAIFAFLARIGLPIAEETLAVDTFLPGIACCGPVTYSKSLGINCR